MSDDEEAMSAYLELIQYNESPTITISFAPNKTSTNPDNLVIPSLQFDQLKKATQIFFKVGEVEDITKYF